MKLSKGQRKVYRITGLVQNVTGNFFSELVQNWMNTFYKANSYGPVTFYKLKMKFEILNCSFEDKIVKHAR